VPNYCCDEVADHTNRFASYPGKENGLLRPKSEIEPMGFSPGKSYPADEGQNSRPHWFGRIGREVVRRISPFGVRVIVFDPYVEEVGGEIELVDLDAILKESDFISIHCPLNESTRYLIGSKEFQEMEKKPLLVNASRGPIIEEKALIRALTEGRISGAGLDVMEEEPPDPQNALLRMENVILSPHVAFYSEESIMN